MNIVREYIELPYRIQIDILKKLQISLIDNDLESLKVYFSDIKNNNKVEEFVKITKEAIFKYKRGI